MLASYTINSLMDIFLYATKMADLAYPGMYNLIGWFALWALIVAVMMMVYKFLS